MSAVQEKSVMMHERPNIVFVTSHDTGRHLGCYGLPEVRSPHLDALAADGVRLTRMFAVSPMCSPARATMMSGLYPQRNGVMHLVHEPWMWAYRPGVRHLSHLLGQAGYHTVLFHHQHEALDPRTLGFAEYRAREPEHASDRLPDPYEHLSADVVAGDFVDWIEHRPPDSPPFYAQVGFFETHEPFDFGDNAGDDTRGIHWPGHLRHIDPADRDTLRQKLAMFQGAIHNMDRAIGRMIAALRQRGLEHNTLFVFTSDHGISFPKAKTFLYDAGLAIAMILRWPAGKLIGGRIAGGLHSSVDMVPTVLDLLGLDPQPGLDGSSFAHDLRGETVAGGRDAIYGEQITSGGGLREARCVRTARWKLIRNFSPSRLSELGAEGAGVTCPAAQLFDLEKDPFEYLNVAADRQYAAVLRDLDARLMAWMKQVDDPILRGPTATPYYLDARRSLQLSVASDAAV